MENKFQNRYIDRGLGFPIVLHNVSMMKVRGEWVPDLNYNAYMKSMLCCKFVGVEFKLNVGIA